LQKIQYDREKYPLIGNCYTDDYSKFVKDIESIRRRYIKVGKSPGFVRIGEIYVSFRENKFTLDGDDVFLSPRETQVLRFLALWYPKIVLKSPWIENVGYPAQSFRLDMPVDLNNKRVYTLFFYST
jgi:hypothetical protein